ncbi:MAG: DNA polymerase III subunit delta, partial [Hyphomicrobiales bacterium]
MAVLQRGALNNYLKEPTTRYRVVLIFGPDRGLVSERADAIMSGLQAAVGAGADDPFGITRIAADEMN